MTALNASVGACLLYFPNFLILVFLWYPTLAMGIKSLALVLHVVALTPSVIYAEYSRVHCLL